MPWKCPACQTPIRHDILGPQPNQVYRCSVCRLELVLDDRLQKLVVAPLPHTPKTDPPR
jgi:hypothetical protein